MEPSRKCASVHIALAVVVLMITLGMTPPSPACTDSEASFSEADEQLHYAPAPRIVIYESNMPLAVAPAAPALEKNESAAPQRLERYADVIITENELHDMARMIYHEARGECAKGQQAVAEVILNRVIAHNFPDTVHEVLRQGAGTRRVQFTPIGFLHTAQPTQKQYDAITAALYGPPILPDYVVYFSQRGENDRVYTVIGVHVFCKQYEWDME